MDMELLSDAPPHHTMPDADVFPPEKRPHADDLLLLAAADPSLSLPIIDLRATAHTQLVRDILRAGKDFGFFQVVNHGVGDDTVRAFRDAAAAFLAMPAADKLPYVSDDTRKDFRVASSHWREYVKVRCHPVAKFAPRWPPQLRDSLAAYAAEVQELAATLLRLVAEGLGLAADFFDGELSGGDTDMSVNYYPPCPDTAAAGTLGIKAHCDRHLLTVLSQGEVAGLQARLHGGNGAWVAVEPIPGAFVVNFGHVMEIVTNDVLRSVEHRVVTSSAAARMSVATLVGPRLDCRVAPAKEIMASEEEEEQNHRAPRYRAFVYGEFVEAYVAAAACREQVLDHFRLHDHD